MKKIVLIIMLAFFGINFLAFSQDAEQRNCLPFEPVRFISQSHDPDFAKQNKMPAKSFYKSRSEWQHIIDSTWGPGDSLSRKLLIFNTYAQRLQNKFDGLKALNMNWDSLYNNYLVQINDSTSKGAFSSIMSHFASSLKDNHTYAIDGSVVSSPLNPGVPVLLLSNFVPVEHFGAFTTVLADSTTLVLRVTPNHPLNLEPGDIILGYEGVPWKSLVYELLDAGLPMYGLTSGCPSSVTYHGLMGAGLNWHLFDTIDILKYSTGDTLHLSVLPMLNLNLPPMVSNEQLAIPNIPFPNVAIPEPDTCVTYGILENTNTGYIFLAAHWPTGTADQQLYEAVNSLKNTDALILDMRFCYGGWALFQQAFELLFHENSKTLDEAYRCSPNTYDLCPANDWIPFRIISYSPDFYDRPIAVLLGPSGYSMADITPQRLRYHPMVKFFGASPNASFGYNEYVTNFSEWWMRYSIADVYHFSEPGVYLNKKEFPIDFPVWFNKDDVAAGIDPIVEKALGWINNLVYGHDVKTDKLLYIPGIDTVKVGAIIENPNSHQVSARILIENLDGSVVDSVQLEKAKTTEGTLWQGMWKTQAAQNTYWLSVKAEDHTSGQYFTSKHSTRVTTIPLLVDSIGFSPISKTKYLLKPFLTNASDSQPVGNIRVKLTSNDSCVKSIIPGFIALDTLFPDQTAEIPGNFFINYDTTTFHGYFNLTFSITSDGWPHWIIDTSLRITPAGIHEEPRLDALCLYQNYPNPFCSATKIAFNIPAKAFVTLKIFDLRGVQVETLVSKELSPGEYIYDWDASKLPGGVYFYNLQADAYNETKKLILLE